MCDKYPCLFFQIAWLKALFCGFPKWQSCESLILRWPKQVVKLSPTDEHLLQSNPSCSQDGWARGSPAGGRSSSSAGCGPRSHARSLVCRGSLVRAQRSGGWTVRGPSVCEKQIWNNDPEEPVLLPLRSHGEFGWRMLSEPISSRNRAFYICVFVYLNGESSLLLGIEYGFLLVFNSRQKPFRVNKVCPNYNQRGISFSTMKNFYLSYLNLE